LLLAVRGGGHNAGGLGICDDGLVIDLAPIKYTRVDPGSHTVTVGADAPGVMSIMQRMRLDSRRRAESFRPRALAD